MRVVTVSYFLLNLLSHFGGPAFVGDRVSCSQSSLANELAMCLRMILSPDLPAFTSQVLGLHVCATTPGFVGVLCPSVNMCPLIISSGLSYSNEVTTHTLEPDHWRLVWGCHWTHGLGEAGGKAFISLGFNRVGDLTSSLVCIEGESLCKVKTLRNGKLCPAIQTKRPEFQYPKLTKIPGVHGNRLKLPASKGAEGPQRSLAGETHRIVSQLTLGSTERPTECECQRSTPNIHLQIPHTGEHTCVHICPYTQAQRIRVNRTHLL